MVPGVCLPEGCAGPAGTPPRRRGGTWKQQNPGPNRTRVTPIKPTKPTAQRPTGNRRTLTVSVPLFSPRERLGLSQEIPLVLTLHGWSRESRHPHHRHPGSARQVPLSKQRHFFSRAVFPQRGRPGHPPSQPQLPNPQGNDTRGEGQEKLQRRSWTIGSWQ